MSGHHRWADTRDARRFRDATGVDRRLGVWCCCPLLDCCHNEDQEPCERGPHSHSGNPATGYVYPWTREEYDAQQRYWSRPDPDKYPEGSLERLVTEAELEEWRKRERDLRCGLRAGLRVRNQRTGRPPRGKRIKPDRLPFGLEHGRAA